MKIILLLTICLTILHPIKNTRWSVTKVISVFQQGQSLIEHEAISSMIEENIKGMEIHFSRDSVFIFQQNKILDRQKIEQIRKDHIMVNTRKRKS